MIATEILFLITGVIGLIYIWSKYNYSYWKRYGLPSVLGNIGNILMARNNLGLHLSEIYKDPKFSNEAVVGIYVVNKPALIIRDLELVKSVLIKDFNKFSNRYASCDPHGDALGSNNLFFVRNPRWKEARSKITPVFTSGKIKQMYPLMLEIANELEIFLDSQVKNDNKFVREVKEMCLLFTTDLIATIAFGLRANSLKNPNGEFRKHGSKMFDYTLMRSLEFFIIFYVPKLVTLLRAKMFSTEFSEFLRSTINYVIKERERSGVLRNDLIDILVSLKKEAMLDQHGDHFAKDNDVLVAQAAVFLTAGFETSSSTMAFTLYELAKQPELQKRLRTEICDELLAENGRISYEKINALPYLSMVLDETLRLYPVLPFLDREHQKVRGENKFSLKPFHDFELPDGMPVYIPIYGIQRDPQYWQSPDTFDPERFSIENKKLQNPMTYLPFGTGPHNCIGNRIGLLQAKIGLVHFFKNHYVTPCEKTVPKVVLDPKALLLQCVGDIYLTVVNDRLYDKKASKKSVN